MTLDELRERFPAYHVWHFDGQPWRALYRYGRMDEPLEAATGDELDRLLAADRDARGRP